jgi:thiosulfate dehydrogenase [quinone] large subunit
MELRQVKTINGTVVEEPQIERFLFNDTRMAAVWLVVQVWLGWQWLDAGWHKFTGEGWMDGGASLKGYWERAVAIPESGRPAISFDWYRDFLNFLLGIEAYTWFGKLIVYGEILVGIGLIVGAFVGIAAFFGATMNWAFIMAGSASSNGVLLVLAIFLILAWKTAGWYGLDRFLLPYIGTPWTRLKETRKPTSDSNDRAPSTA